ncbi:hypothetical protein [Micromonospora sp. NPDC050495]|uniref:hypothetical protein n=1 Tax=Micromonospora sp. NPDC050495 TaxID=3154936 RepID=UPI0033CC878F
MTGTSGADDGSRAAGADDRSPTGGGAVNGANPAGGLPAADPSPADGTTSAAGPSRDRWQRWLARTRQWWATARQAAARMWTAARPVLRQLRWPDQVPDRPAVTLVARRVAPALRLPAQGHVYHFVVRTMFTWSSDDARPELFGWYVDYFQPHAMHRLRRIAARCAAPFPPDRPGAVARALAAALTGENALPWDYTYGDVTLRCEPDVSVHLDEPVRKLLQPYWDQRIALEWERDLHRRRAAYADEHPPGPAPGADAAPGRAEGAGMPESLREERPPRQRGTGSDAAPPRPGQQRRRGPRPHSAVEQFNLLDPLLQPPAMPPAEPDRPEPEDPARGDRETGPPTP